MAQLGCALEKVQLQIRQRSTAAAPPAAPCRVRVRGRGTPTQPGGRHAAVRSRGAAGAVLEASSSSPTAVGPELWADVPTDLLQVLLQLQHVRASLVAAGEGHPGARAALGEVPTAAESATGVAVWTHALQRGNLPTELSFQDGGLHAAFPCQPLRGLLLATLAHLQVASFADRYPSLRSALLTAVAEASVSYATLRRDAVLPAMAQRAVESEEDRDGAHADELAVTQTEAYKLWAAQRAAAAEAKKAEAQAAAAAKVGSDGGAEAAAASLLLHTMQQPADWAGDPASWQAAQQVCTALHKAWAPAAAALRRAGVAFTGLDEALGGTRGSFSLDDPSWSRPGWDLLAKYSHTLAECKELRDLVRRLGRGAGWGPLRLSPTQRWDDHGRDGLLRDPLEAAETRSLTRGGDVAMMLPAEASLYAKGRTLRAARLLFYARAAERALLSYARDGWSVLPASDIAPWIREVRPTAERGPILLCLDSSGSMRGAREAVAKALALECMRAARVQERRCFCFAFSGPALVEELELGSDPQGLSRLLDFMERSFNGGSDLNTPLGACIRRLATAEWANSDILVVSDGELRQPSAEVTRSIGAAKADLGLRIHGLQLPANAVIGHSTTDRDTGVLRQLCLSRPRGGKEEVLLQEFASWDALDEDVFAAEEVATRAAVKRGKAEEKWREEEAARLQAEQREKQAGRTSHEKRLSAHPAAKYDKVKNGAR